MIAPDKTIHSSHHLSNATDSNFFVSQDDWYLNVDEFMEQSYNATAEWLETRVAFSKELSEVFIEPFDQANLFLRPCSGAEALSSVTELVKPFPYETLWQEADCGRWIAHHTLRKLQRSIRKLGLIERPAVIILSYEDDFEMISGVFQADRDLYSRYLGSKKALPHQLPGC